jgi:hypothetical protein
MHISNEIDLYVSILRNHVFAEARNYSYERFMELNTSRCTV